MNDAELDEPAREQAAELLVHLYDCYTKGDCDLAEINPLILTPDNKVHALDAKVTLDENASFRHPEWEEFRADEFEDPREKLAKEKGLNYIGLDGTVGIIANGAGLAMSTLDVVNQVGGSAANFLDIGGGANADVMASALEVINTDPEGEGDLRQHLRRHHPRRRGRQRCPRSAPARRHLDADRAATRRDQRRRGSRDPRAAPERLTDHRTHDVGRRSPSRGPRERLKEET